MRYTHLRHDAEPTRQIIALAATAAASLALFLLAAPPVQAAFPGGNGLIAFESNLDGDMDIYTIDPAAPGVPAPLTANTGFHDRMPAWSPDGTKIAFASNALSADLRTDIWVMNADGSNPIQLTTDPFAEYEPAWSPDGTRIAYGKGGGLTPNASDVWVMSADGTNQVAIASDPSVLEGEPAWSPDGTRIAHARGTLNPVTEADVWVMDPDGANAANLTNTPGSWDTEPAWSPDGAKIAYRSNLAGGTTPEDIWVMSADGSSNANVSNSPSVAESSPEWSPDGGTIAYQNVVNPGTPQAESDVFVMSADGSNHVNLTNLPGTSEGSPDWQSVSLPPGPAPSPAPQPTPDASAAPPASVAATDTKAPEITGLRVSPSRFLRSAKPTARVSRKRRGLSVGAKIKFTLSEAATVKITIKARGKGKKIRRGGTLTRSVRAGNNFVAFSGRIGRRALHLGSYRVTVRATDAAGNRSTARRASFQIVRR